MNSPAREPEAHHDLLPSAAGPAEYVVIGKDVLELLSSAMYVDPLTIFREYVQNAADAIDQAREEGVVTADARGEVVISLDAADRSVRIRDNGSGIPIIEAAPRLLSIGGSTKRGTRARGFRGVGRLAGLAYCRQLVFRTRAAGDRFVFELRWDCVKLKAALREVGRNDDLPGVVNRIVGIDLLSGEGYPAHFFEVEMIDVVRHHRRDALLNEDLVRQYLSEVAPVPFDEGFRHAQKIHAHVGTHVRMGDLHVEVNGGAPLRRPHRDAFPVTDVIDDEVSELELLRFEGRDGGVAAVGWMIHHSYLGALPERAGVKGIRLRAGNVQVGGHNLLEEVFPEPRFNAWAIGEIHVVDPRLVPNARRDHFEQNVHFADLAAQVQPLARGIAKQCRAASIERNRLKKAQVVASTLARELPGLAAQRPELADELARCAKDLRQVARFFVGREGAPELKTLDDVAKTLTRASEPPSRDAAEAYLQLLVQTGAMSKADLIKLAKGLTEPKRK